MPAGGESCVGCDDIIAKPDALVPNSDTKRAISRDALPPQWITHHRHVTT